MKVMQDVYLNVLLHHIIQFIEDGNWRPLRRCDLAVFLGVQPYYLSRVLSSLRHFSNVKTLSLDEFYQPNADYSLSAIAMGIDERLCSGCGDCVAVCRTMSKGLAINVVRGKIIVKPELCVGCGSTTTVNMDCSTSSGARA